MSFLVPLAFAGALLAIPILLLYMLRLRRREVVVSSTYLWSQVMQDKEANTPWQRLRRNLLMILQLIILALLVMALARPFVTVPALASGQVAVLIDASASMNATDSDHGTRFAEAQLRALEIVNTLGAGTQMTVIRAGAQPEVVAPATSDPDALRAAILGMSPGTQPADWLSALALASAGAGNAEAFTTVIISDGGLGDADNLPAISLPGEVRFVPVGRSGENVAISALATRALPGEPPQLFAQLTNYGDRPAEVIFSLRLDGATAPVISERYIIPPQSNLPIVSTAALAGGFSTLQADLTLSVNSEGRDYLPDDNRAWAVAQATSERRLLVVTSGNLFLEQMLRSLPGVTFFRIEPDRPLPSQPYDLIIFDGTVPDSLPPGDLFFINPPRSTALFRVGEEREPVTNIRLQANDDRLAFVDFSTVNVLRLRAVTPEGDWAQALISADEGALLLAGDIDARQVAVLTFDLRQSDLPLQIAYPVLLANLLAWFTPGDILVSGGALSVGDPVVLRPPLAADSLRFTLPDGTTRQLPIEREQAVFTETSQTGLYTVEVVAQGEVVTRQSFAVNLFAPQESDIAPRPVRVGGQIVSGELGEDVGQLEFWSLLALLALAFLLIEWAVYHRGLQVRTVFSPGRNARARAPRRAPAR